MALVLADRVRDATTTTGIGTVTLSGTAPTGYQNFSVIGNGNTTYYTISGGSEWEVGIGTYTAAGTTLSRDTVLASSAGGAKVSFSGGIKDVFVTYPSGKAIFSDSIGNVGIGTSSPGAKLTVLTNTATSGVEESFSVTNAVDSNVFIRVSGTANTDKKATIGPSTSTALVFNTADTERMRINAGGNVGIGNTGPTYKLQVTAPAGAQNIFLAGQSGVSNGYTIASDGTYLTHQWYSTGSETMRLNASGNLGIGTTSPGVPLDVNGAARIRTSLFVYGSGDRLNIFPQAAGSGVQLLTTNNANSAYAPMTLDGTPIVFNYAGAEVMRLTDTGLGIGTSSPGTKLDVNGQSSFRNAINLLTGSQAYFYNPAGTAYGYVAMDTSNILQVFNNAGSAVAISTAGSERMRIDSSGNVGIGTAAPSFRLDVIGTGRITGLTQFDNDILLSRASLNYLYFNDALAFSRNGVGERMRIDASGNVGIGTSSPATKLNVIGDIQLSRSATASDAAINFGSSANNYIYGGNSSNIMAFAVNGSERMRITGAGRVGIGTSAPGYALDIVGNSPNINLKDSTAGVNWYQGPNSSNLYTFGNNAGSTLNTVFLNTNVGIGTNNPDARLEVAAAASPYINIRTASASNKRAGIAFIQSAAAQYEMGVDLYVNNDRNFYLYDSAAGATRLFVSSSGNVGIGTVIPNNRLTVVDGGVTQYKAAGDNNAFQASTSDASNNYLRLQNTTGTLDLTCSNGFSFLYTSQSTLLFGANSTERARIDASGNLLVGTTTANGIVSVVGDQVSVGSAGGSSSLGIQVKGTTLSALPAAQVQSYIATGNSSIGTAGDLIVAPRTDVACSIRFVTGTTPAERVRIDASGNVGIGTDTPGAKLAVNGSNDVAVLTSSTATSSILMIDTSGAARFGSRSGSAIIDVGGSERMRIDTSGNVGIGTSSIGSKLDVSGDIRTSTSVLTGTDTNGWGRLVNAFGALYIQAGSLNSGSATAQPIIFSNMYGTSERMRIDANGNVGIGAAPSVRFQVNQDQAAYSYFDYYNVTNGGGIVWRQIVRNIANTGTASVDFAKLIGGGFALNNNDTHANNYTSFGVGGTERMRIDSSGNLLVGTTTTNGKVTVYGDANATFLLGLKSSNPSGTQFYVNFINSSGTAVGSISASGATTSYNTSSDARLKENIADADNASALIDAIQVRQFDWKADGSHQRYGMVAQELLEVAPEVVSVPTDEEDMMGVDYSKLVPMLIKEIQSLRARVAQLEGK